MLKNLKLLVAGALLAASSAQATVYTYKYTAVIDSIQKKEELDYWGPVDVTTTNLLLGDSATVHDILHGQFIIDTSDTPSSSSSTSATYFGQNFSAYVKFPSGFSYGVEGPSEYGGGELGVVNSPTGDAFNISYTLFGSGRGEMLALGFSDPTGSAFSSTQLSNSPLNFANLPITSFYYYYGDNSFSTNVWVYGHITAVQLDGPAPVPEPATYGMMLAGLGLLGAVARKKRRQQ